MRRLNVLNQCQQSGIIVILSFAFLLPPTRSELLVLPDIPPMCNGLKPAPGDGAPGGAGLGTVREVYEPLWEQDPDALYAKVGFILFIVLTTVVMLQRC